MVQESLPLTPFLKREPAFSVDEDDSCMSPRPRCAPGAIRIAGHAKGLQVHLKGSKQVLEQLLEHEQVQERKNSQKTKERSDVANDRKNSEEMPKKEEQKGKPIEERRDDTFAPTETKVEADVTAAEEFESIKPVNIDASMKYVQNVVLEAEASPVAEKEEVMSVQSIQKSLKSLKYALVELKSAGGDAEDKKDDVVQSVAVDVESAVQPAVDDIKSMKSVLSHPGNDTTISSKTAENMPEADASATVKSIFSSQSKTSKVKQEKDASSTAKSIVGTIKSIRSAVTTEKSKQDTVAEENEKKEEVVHEEMQCVESTLVVQSIDETQIVMETLPEVSEPKAEIQPEADTPDINQDAEAREDQVKPEEPIGFAPELAPTKSTSSDTVNGLISVRSITAATIRDAKEEDAKKMDDDFSAKFYGACLDNLTCGLFGFSK